MMATASEVKVGMSDLLIKLYEVGLMDPLVFEAVRFADADDLITALYPNVVAELTDEAHGLVETMLRDAAARAQLARRLEDAGMSGSLADAVWAAGAAHARAKAAKATPPTAVATRRAATAWTPTATWPTRWTTSPPGWPTCWASTPTRPRPATN